MNYKQNHLLFELSKRDSLSAALQQAFGIRKYYAAGQQDMWVALAVEPGKRDGYYVDVGSADGVLHSIHTSLTGWDGEALSSISSSVLVTKSTSGAVALFSFVPVHGIDDSAIFTRGPE